MKTMLMTCLAYCLMNVAGCGGGGDRGLIEVEPLRFVDVSFPFQDSIPVRFTCKAAKQVFPSFSWSSSPEKAMSYVLIMDDPDAVKVTGKVWNHWVLYNIPRHVTVLHEGMDVHGTLPVGVWSGKTSSGDTAYAGPCPPAGQKHSYVFTLYGVDMENLGIKRAATSAEVRAAMLGHVTDSALYKGTFEVK